MVEGHMPHGVEVRILSSVPFGLVVQRKDATMHVSRFEWTLAVMLFVIAVSMFAFFGDAEALGQWCRKC